jgi:hypothetical protein
VQKVEKATGSITRGVCILAAVAAVLVLAPAAFAQTDPYAGTGSGTQGQVAGGGGGGNAGTPSVASEPTDPDDGSVLAFTGLDVALIAGGGLLLLAGGVGLSRLVARNPASGNTA